MISTDPPSPVQMEVYRLGYYGGKGGRQVAEVGPIDGTAQPTPQPAGQLMNCQWNCSARLTIGDDWVSGVYVAKLTELKQKIQSYIIFVVLDDRKADLVYQVSDHTWQAYNRWPSQYSLYDDGQNEWHWGGKSQVSFNRPYGKYCQILDAPLSTGSGEFFLWEFPFVYWLEREGYDVTYVSNTDTHRDSSTACRGKGFLSVGHDEYWTIEMFRHVQSAIQHGVMSASFPGTQFVEKFYGRRPLVHSPHWCFERRAEQRIRVHELAATRKALCQRNDRCPQHGTCDRRADWICSLPEHWIYEKTGMNLGINRRLDRLGCHGDPAPIPGGDRCSRTPSDGSWTVQRRSLTATVYRPPR